MKVPSTMNIISTIVALTLFCCTSATHEESTENNNATPYKLTKEDEKLLENLTLILHRNGESNECGRNQKGATLNSMKLIMDLMNTDETTFSNKYTFESMLSSVSVHSLPSDSCVGDNEDLKHSCGSGFVSYCDGGDDKTPKLPDHNDLIPITCAGKSSLPCHFHNREGVRITSLSMLVDLVKWQNEKMMNDDQCEANNEEKECKAEENGGNTELHLYAVPAGRVFMFAPSFVGEVFNISHVSTGEDKNDMSLEVLSLEPRVFEIKNFFTPEEADGLIEQLMSEKRESHKLQRSTTGSDADKVENEQRTSESGFVTDGNGMPIKRRSFSLLGFDTYYESFADGLQVLRYNQTKAYTPHHDYFTGYFANDYHDYDSVHVGTNRFATILLYMNGGEGDAVEGGETVFPGTVSMDGNALSQEQALEEIRTKYANVLKPGSWEERLVVSCKTKLSIRPAYAKAVLFYSQNPDGSLDDLSRHAGCPVLGGTKWLANIWVWNGPRNTYPGEPKIKSKQNQAPTPITAPKQRPRSLKAQFRNTGKTKLYETAELYFRDQFWDKFGSGAVLNVNTFEGHEWNVRVGGDIVKEWVMTSSAMQVYEV